MFLLLGDILESISSRRDYGGQTKSEEHGCDCFIIFIHAQQSGLYRIYLQGPHSKYTINLIR